MPEPVINLAALEPLFAPHEEPNQHRARAQGDQPAQTKKGRRLSKIAIAQSLRSHVKQWRETDYPGASDTTRELLHHWFGRDHLIEAGGLRVPFRYYFCQREAMETLIYLYEVRGIRSLTPLMGPTVSRAKALDTGAELRKRITGRRGRGHGDIFDTSSGLRPFSPVEAEKESVCEFFKSPAGKTLFRRCFVVYFPP